MKRFFLLTAFVFSSCASQSNSLRSPSSAKVDINLQYLMDKPSPRAEARAFVMRLLRVRLRAQALVQEFDASLARSHGETDIFQLPSYRRMLAARPIAEGGEDNIVEMFKEAAALGPENEKGQLVIAGFGDALFEVRKKIAHRVLLNDLFVALSEQVGEKKLVTDAMSSGGDLFSPIGANELGIAAEQSKGEFLKLIKELPSTDDVKEEIEAGAAQHVFLKSSQREQRQPSALKHYPSIEAAGNMTGSTFPLGTYAITYDDGPHDLYTMQNVANLEANGIQATFFWITNYARFKPKIVQAVKAAGMALANHSYMHANVLNYWDLRRLKTTVDKEIIQSTAEFTKIYGFKPKFFRLPYGSGHDDEDIREIIADEGMIHVRWNIDSADWQDKNPRTVLARVERQMRETRRGIILFHDTQAHSVKASRDLMEKMRGKVRWVTIPEIFKELNEK